MHYLELMPPPALRGHLSALWCFLAPPETPSALAAPASHAIPPDGGAILAAVLRGGQLTRVATLGPSLSAPRVPVHAGHLYLGVRARPGGGQLFLDGPGADWREQRQVVDPKAPLAQDIALALAGCDDPVTGLRRLAQVMRGRLSGAAAPDPGVARVVDHILRSDGQIAIPQAMAAAGMSYRSGLRRFAREVGLLPKELARLRRLRHACQLALEARPPPTAEVSAQVGFADQAHMSREFSQLYGWSPSLTWAYLRRIDHGRSRATRNPPA